MLGKILSDDITRILNVSEQKGEEKALYALYIYIHIHIHIMYNAYNVEV